MRKSTKAMIERWRKNMMKIGNRSKRRSIEFMIDSIEDRINMNKKELGEDG